jgi:hypothetical protein
MVMLSLSHAAYGYEFKLPIEDAACDSLDGRLEHIRKVSNHYYDWLLDKIERVPPDMEDYISNEYKASLEELNSVKFDNVTSNKFFRAWNLRKSIKEFIEESNDGYFRLTPFNAMHSKSKEFEMIFYMNMIEKNYDISDEFDEYEAFDRNRSPRVFDSTASIPTSFTAYKLGYSTLIHELIKCSFKNSE